MSGPVFAISPAKASRPEPVTLVMPSSGYHAAASIADPCGHVIKGATVTVKGNVAYPSFGTYRGTAFVQWHVTAAHPARTGASVGLVLASRQTVGGKTSTCTTGTSPYGGEAGHALTVHPAAPHAFPVMGAAGGGIILAVVVIAALAWRRLTTHTGSRAAR